jgi:hypothetical protein
MASTAETLNQFEQLDDDQKRAAAAAIQQQVRGLPDPSGTWVNILWVVIVAGIIALALLSAMFLYFLLDHSKSAAAMASVVSAAIGVLAGLLAPSPVSSRGGTA